MKITEIVSGSLLNPNIPDFSKSTYECDMDGYKIMSTIWKGYYALGILDENNNPMSYCIVEPEKDGYNRFVEIYTTPQHRGKNFAAIILLALKGKLGIKLRIDPDDIVSKNGRALILAMIKNGRLQPALLDGTKLSYDQVSDMFNELVKTDSTLILEGHNIKYKKYDNDETLHPMWYIRENVLPNGIKELYEE